MTDWVRISVRCGKSAAPSRMPFGFGTAIKKSQEAKGKKQCAVQQIHNLSYEEFASFTLYTLESK